MNEIVLGKVKAE